MSPPRRNPVEGILTSAVIGGCAGAAALLGCSLLLFFAPGMLRTTAFLVGLLLAALAGGLWVARGSATPANRRRWLLLLLAYVSAGVYSALWTSQPTLQQTTLGSALAALFLLAQPFYATGALLSAEGPRAHAAAVLAGAAAGILLSAFLLVPRVEAYVTFFASATLLLAARFWSAATSSPQSNMEAPMTGKVALVTGVGSEGQVGYTVARAIIEAGGRVVCVDRNGKAPALAAALGPETTALGLSADLTDANAVDGIIAQVKAHFGRLDAVVNVAGGLTVMKSLAETSNEEWRAELQRNAETAFTVSRAALPLLRETQGSIVNFASMAGARAVGNLGAYSASKAAVIALTRALAIEEKSQGVRCNALAPGMIDTGQNRTSSAQPDEARWVSREQVASVVVFLCSEAASAINGETITLAGNTIA